MGALLALTVPPVSHSAVICPDPWLRSHGAGCSLKPLVGFSEERARPALLLTAANSPLGSCAFLGSVVSCAVFPTLGYCAHSPLPSSCPSLQAGEDLGSGSTTSWCPAPGFYCPWPFSQSLDPIQFPHIFWSLQNLPSLPMSVILCLHSSLGHGVMP